MKNQILKIIRSFNFDEKNGRFIETKVWVDIYTYDSLKSKFLTKNKATSNAHQLTIDDEILLLIQNGLSEKDSIVITDKFISIAESNLFSKNIIKKVLWSEVDSIRLNNHSVIFNFTNGEIGNYDADIIFSKNKEKTSSFVELLQRILNTTKGKKESIVNINNKKIDINKHKKIIIPAVIFLVCILGLVFLTIWNNHKVKTDNFVENENTASPIIPSKPMYDTIWSEEPKEDYTKIIKFKTINVFYEPYQVTMEAHKLAGLINLHGDKIIIPIEIPKNTIYWVYRMQLTNAKIESGNTKLVDEVDKKVKSWSILDNINPLKKEEIVSNLARELLNKIYEPNKEKPFTNAFFIDNQKQAQNFQDGLQFKYDINNSIKNTHSRNGLIKFNENKFVYLALENESYSDDIYVSLEVVSLIEETKYFKLEKNL